MKKKKIEIATKRVILSNNSNIGVERKSET